MTRPAPAPVRSPSQVASLGTILGIWAHPDDTAADPGAYAHRGAVFSLSLNSGWKNPAHDEAEIGWARSSWTAMAPFANGGVYVNFADVTDTDADKVFGTSAARLAEVRGDYDPDGLFAAAAVRP